jgi:hypothetical protein
MFIEGIFQLSDKEQVALAALLNTLTGWNMLSEAAQKGLQKATGKAIAWLKGKSSRQIEKLEAKLDWDPNVLQRKLEEEMQAFSLLEPEGLHQELADRLKELAAIEDEDPKVQANALVHRAAENLGLDVRRYLSAEALEEATFLACLEEFLQALKKELASQEPAGKRRFEEILRGELCKLSSAELESLAQALPSVEVTAVRLTCWLESENNSKELASHFGSGSLLLLSVLLRAMSLFTGVGFPLELGGKMDSTLSFLLSGPFLYLTMTSKGSLLKISTGNVGDQLAKLLLIVGRGKLSA